jgi:dGTPase
MAEFLVRTQKEKVACVGGLDVDVAEAAALAHDLGHPPFGHLAEKVLNTQCENHHVHDGFEGNAQSFRIVTRLSYGGSPDPGLNLTAATLNAILKYPWMRTRKHIHDDKWGAYVSEESDFRFARQSRADEVCSVEAQIMNWADDISYAVHDLEDFFRAGFIPLDRIADPAGSKEQGTFIARASAELAADGDVFDAGETFQEIAPLLTLQPYTGSKRDRSALHRMASVLISRFINATNLGDSASPLVIVETVRREVAVLKQITRLYVILNPSLATLQEGQAKVVNELFERLFEWVKNEERDRRLPGRLREGLSDLRDDKEASHAYRHNSDRLCARAVADYIALLTEDQVHDLLARLQGDPHESVVQTWITS